MDQDAPSLRVALDLTPLLGVPTGVAASLGSRPNGWPSAPTSNRQTDPSSSTLRARDRRIRSGQATTLTVAEASSPLALMLRGFL
jgi:hypothetical protein